MATPSRPTIPDLIQQLEQEPFRFDFFQAVRVLEWAAAERARTTGTQRYPVGEDAAPRDEAVRFRAVSSFAFPPGEVASYGPGGDDPPTPPQLSTAFLGLTGPAGVLPQHYTQLLIERIRNKDYSLRDFFDVFHHRLISLFYRAWRKYRHYIDYERSAASGQIGQDLFTFCLFSLIGYGIEHHRGRQVVDDEAFLYYGGHFAHYPRNADSLERLLADYLDVPAQVLQFVGQWLYLEAEDQSSMGTAGSTAPANNQLGVNVVVGRRVWGVESKFRVRLGPLNYRDFLDYTPRGKRLQQAAQMIRSYAGPELDFDVQPVLRSDEVPRCHLGGSQGESYLGWNAWLISRPMQRDAEDAVFTHEGWPT